VKPGAGVSHCGSFARSRYDHATEPVTFEAERRPGFYYFITECCTVWALQSIVLRCRVTLPFAELRQMLLVDAINLGLHLGMFALDQDRECAGAGRLAKTSASAVQSVLL
jgi:hypothetical protein